MVIFQKKQSYGRRLFWPLCVCAALTYITFHALNGNHGIYALLKEQRKQEVQQQELAAVKAHRRHQEQRVALLSDHSLDLDLLDEQARRVLGYAGKDEFIYVPQGDN